MCFMAVLYQEKYFGRGGGGADMNIHYTGIAKFLSKFLRSCVRYINAF